MGSQVEKAVRVNELFDVYGALLTPRQREILSFYYQLDFSLGEIADTLDVTRQAVHDSIARGVETLEQTEAMLGLLTKLNRIRDVIGHTLPLIERSCERLDDTVQVVKRDASLRIEMQRIAEDLLAADDQLKNIHDILQHRRG